MSTLVSDRDGLRSAGCRYPASGAPQAHVLVRPTQGVIWGLWPGGRASLRSFDRESTHMPPTRLASYDQADLIRMLGAFAGGEVCAECTRNAWSEGKPEARRTRSGRTNPATQCNCWRFDVRTEKPAQNHFGCMLGAPQRGGGLAHGGGISGRGGEASGISAHPIHMGHMLLG